MFQKRYSILHKIIIKVCVKRELTNSKSLENRNRCISISEVGCMNEFFCHILKKSNEMINSEAFKTRSISSEKAFTRNRKLTFPVMISLIMNMLTRTMQIELNDFFYNVFNTAKSVTKQAFLKQGRIFFLLLFKNFLSLLVILLLKRIE